MTESEHNLDTHKFHSRKRSLTDNDIEELIIAFEKRAAHPHSCRFSSITEEEFYASVKFFKNLNEALTSGRNIVAKTILVLLITFLFGMFGAGILAKLKTP